MTCYEAIFSVANQLPVS